LPVAEKGSSSRRSSALWTIDTPVMNPVVRPARGNETFGTGEILAEVSWSPRLQISAFKEVEMSTPRVRNEEVLR
jgi:hypothetical protein